MNRLSHRIVAALSLLLPFISANFKPTPLHAADLAQLLVSNVFSGSVEQVGDSGANPSTLVQPFRGGLLFASGVTMGPDGNIYVSSAATGQVFQYYPDGTPVSSTPFLTLPEDFDQTTSQNTPAAAAHLQFYNGSLYISDHRSDDILQYPVTKDPVTGALSIDPNVTPTNAASGLFAAGGFTIAPNGDLYASSFAVGFFDAPGSPPFQPAVIKVPHGGSPAPFAYPVTDSSGNVTNPATPFNPNGVLLVHNSLLVADIAGSEIVQYDENGQNPTIFATIPGPAGVANSPSDFVLGPDGHSIYVAVLGDGDPTNPDDPNQVPDGFVLKYNFTVDSNGHITASGSPITIDTGFAASSIALGVQRGDLNLDGQIDVTDLRNLLAALANPDAYEASKHITPGELEIMADINGDDQVNNADIQALINQLLASGASLTSVPEPSTALLAGLGLGTLFQIRRRRIRA